MKKYWFLLILFALAISSDMLGQGCQNDDCDPYVTSMGYSIACQDLGGTAILTITWGMDSGDGVCSAPAGSWRMVISFPGNGVYGISGVDAVTGPDFDWTYSGAPNFALTGISNKPIGINLDADPPFADGGDILVVVQALSANDCTPVLSNVQISLIPNILGGCIQAFNNDINNDYISATFGVDDYTTPLDLLSFEGKMIECGKVELNWTAESEVNSDYIEVLRSTDGKKWVSVGMVGSQNLRSGTASYTFTDYDLDNYVRNYYYRLKQVDLNRNSTLFRIIGVKYDCVPAHPEMKIFPNPASEKVKINITNISENRDVKAVIMNSNGHVVDDLMINSIHGAEVELKRFPSGVYKVQTLDLDEPVYQRFIHIK